MDIILKFKRNIAGLAGNNIYATPLYNCSFLYPQHDKFELVHIDWKSIAHFDAPKSPNNGLESMSSQPVKICSCYLNHNTNKVVKNCSQLYAIPNIEALTLQHQVVHHLDQLNIYVHPCPMGFMLKEDECVCDSFIADMSPSTKCNITRTTISIYSGQWLGHIPFHNKSK